RRRAPRIPGSWRIQSEDLAAGIVGATLDRHRVTRAQIELLFQFHRAEEALADRRRVIVAAFRPDDGRVWLVDALGQGDSIPCRPAGGALTGSIAVAPHDRGRSLVVDAQHSDGHGD